MRSRCGIRAICYTYEQYECEILVSCGMSGGIYICILPTYLERILYKSARAHRYRYIAVELLV